MKIYHSLNDFKPVDKAVITVGTFDGVHIGHKKIITRLATIAQEQNGESVLITFWPHPRVFLQKESLQLINTIDEKIELFKKCDLDNLIIHPFDKDFSRISSLSFIRDILVNKLNVKKLVIGYDHHFGRNREGDKHILIECASVYEFNIEEISKENLNDISISSTKIRKALEIGNIQTANHFLGYHFSISGKVIHGNHIGTKLGFATANIQIDYKYKILPKNGVYAVIVNIGNKTKKGMLNIGTRPTIENNIKSIEVHILDFEKCIYGENISIQFIEFMREEKKFKSLEALKNQLKQDKKQVSNLLNKINKK